MELNEFELEALNKVIPLLPTKKKFTVEEILTTIGSYNNLGFEEEYVQKLDNLKITLTNFFLDNAFADDMSNPFIYKYVEGQKSNEYSLRLSLEGIKLKESKNYSDYLKLIEREKKSIRIDKLKNNINLIFSILAAIASIIALYFSIYPR